MNAVPRASTKISTSRPTAEEAILFLLCLTVSGIKRYVERRRVALPVLGQRKQQLVPAALEDAVFAVQLVALSLFGVRSLRVDLVCERIVEVELRRELVTLFGFGAAADLEVDVDGPALVPAGIDRREPRSPAIVR